MQYRKRIVLENPDQDIEPGGLEIPEKEKPRPERRRKGKKKARKKKRSAFSFYFINILVALIIIAIIAYLLLSSIFITKKVVVKGTDLYTESEIENHYLKGGKYKNSSVYQLIMTRLSPAKDEPFIESASITLDSPSVLRINVKEKSFLGVIARSDGKLVYFDDDGIVQEIESRDIGGVLKVTGLSTDKVKKAQHLPADDETIKLILNTVKTLKKYKITTSGISFNGESDMSCQIGDISADIGGSEYLNEKIMRLDIILPKLSGYKGTLHLENWTPENKDVVFEISQ